MNSELPPRPAERVESRLITAIVDGEFAINSTLPPERELARRLGVTRPTLREALQRLARDGWIEIHHGKSTRVRDYWHEGNLAVLGTIARQQGHAPPDFVPNLLHVRELLAPAYARLAVKRSARNLARFLEDYQNLIDTPDVFARADWELHRYLTIESGNPIFTLILNGFKELYPHMGRAYFTPPRARARSRKFYADLREAAQARDPERAEAITREVMQDSIELWKRIKR
jgi:GntR family transcriptional regulator, negative regulator for fad regulon and positive regulator of fabA